MVVDADRRKLDGMSRTHSPPGALSPWPLCGEYATVDDILNAAREKGEPPYRGVRRASPTPQPGGGDPHRRRRRGPRRHHPQAPLPPTSPPWWPRPPPARWLHVPVARVANLPPLLKELKEEGVWVFGTAMNGSTSLYQADLKGPAAIVIGSEGRAWAAWSRRTATSPVSIPMFGKINSLNALRRRRSSPL